MSVMTLRAIALLLFATCISASNPTSWVEVGGGAWEPDQVALSQLKSGIEVFVKTQAAQRNAQLPDWSGYRFQYQGQLKGGRRVIFVNAFCHTFGDERLKSEFLTVFDGGPCFFTLEYDPEART